jgi:hypothetical protein
MTGVHVKYLNTPNAVVVIVVCELGLSVVFFSDFGHHAAGYDIISNSIEGNLGDQFFHEACIWFVSQDGGCFGINSVCVAMLDGANVYKDLRQFREVSFIGGAL